MKKLLYMLLLFTALNSYAKGGGETNFKAFTVSYLNIFGKTNLNSFEFYLGDNSESPIAGIDPATGTMQKADVNIPVRRLKTENKYMYSDFLALLKEPEYPYISIGIDENSLQSENESSPVISPIVDITIAGITNQYTIKCDVENEFSSKMIKGETKIRLTDFNIQPPTKMLGLVKVKDEIDINFGILFSNQINQVSYDH
jgi:hypothetical protein